MKNTLFIISLATTVLLASCSDWLDVQPETEKDRNELINSASGFEQMVYGTYINMTSTSLYGDALSYGLLSGLARDYTYKPAYNSSNWKDYQYTMSSVRSQIDAIWSKMYNNITNVNSVLNSIEEKKGLFDNNEGDIVEGEMLTMRAYCHFDLLRMFAPAYADNPDAVAIPYVETYETARYPHLKSSEVVAKVLADLDKAEACFVAGNDPLIKGRQDITYSGKGNFLANRQYRFNYWSVIAEKARVYLYMGDKENALKYARQVIDDGPFSWTQEAAISSGDRVFQTELISALDVTSLPDYYDSNFKSEKYCLYEMGWSSPNVYTSIVFDDTNDYRYLYLLTNDKYNNKTIPCKYKQDTGSGKTMKKQTVPLIRLGEMYLIAAECLAPSAPAEAIALLRELRLHRGYLTADRGIADGLQESAIKDIIAKEMRKETYLEGQMWFFLKRLQSPQVPYYTTWGNPTTNVDKSVYTFPMPEDEKEYGIIPNEENK